MSSLRRHGRRWLRSSIAAAIVAAPAAASAYTCTVGATAVAFGVYDPSAGSANDSTGTVTVTCTPNLVALLISYTVRLSSGGAGSFAPRSLSAGASTLQYQLYRDAARSIVWGDGSGVTSTVSGGFTLSLIVPVSAAHTIYGRMPAGQGGVSAGSYSDTITVTVSY